jgi:hypothetical protein
MNQPMAHSIGYIHCRYGAICRTITSHIVCMSNTVPELFHKKFASVAPNIVREETATEVTPSVK